MKKFISLILSFCVLMSLCACSSSSDDESNTETTVAATVSTMTHGDNISESLSTEVLLNYVLVSENDGRYDASISIDPAEELSDFGIYILLTQVAYENEFSENERGSFDVTYLVGGDTEKLIRFSSNKYDNSTSSLSGKIIDLRTGDLVMHSISNIDDLCELYPATAIYLAKSNVDANDLVIYEEVMDVLEIDYDTPEDEIFESMAPKYGMSAEELKQFVSDITDQIYSTAAGSDSQKEVDSTETTETSSEPQGAKMTIEFYFGSRTGTYSGDLNEDGLPDSYGTFTSANSEGESWTYEGDWVDGHWNGTGTSTWQDGATYNGEFVDDYQSGFGSYTFDTGVRFEGTFDHGVASGEGVLYFTDGTSFEGTFENLNEAVGTYILDGIKYQAVMENGDVTYYHNTGVPIEPSTDSTTEPITENTTEPTVQPTDATVNIESQTSAYILNTNSRKFHKPSCTSAKKISASNRSEFSGTREEIIAKGYEPCKNCNP